MIISSTGARRGRYTRRLGLAQAPDSHLLSAPVAAVPSPQAVEISVGQRLKDWKTLAGFGISAAIIIFFIMTTRLDVGLVWTNIRTADVRYLLVALAVYFGAFLFRGLRWQLLLSRAGLDKKVRLPGVGGLVEMIYLSWFVNCLVPAKLGDGYRAYLLNRRTGADMGRTLGTVVGERMADVLALVALLLASGLLVIGKLAGANTDLVMILFIGLGLAVCIGVFIAALRVASGRLSAMLPARWRAIFARFVEGMLRTFRRDVQLPLYALTGLIWGCEVLRIWLVMESFHISGLAPSVIVFTALAGSLLSTIPLTPAGLGAVEGASVAILTAFGVAGGLAGAVAVVDRVINYWSNIPVGGALYLFNRRK